VTEFNYDETVELAFTKAKENAWTVLQDTTAPGYTEITTWIMQGYTAMVDEALEQMAAMDSGAAPSHVILQVGVGSMAGAVLGYLVERSRADGRSRPVSCTIEPRNAACAFASAERGDGTMATVEGDLESMMAGLCCGVPSDLGWPILAKYVDGGYFWIDDELAGNGMRACAKEGVEAGECGGAGAGLLQRLMVPDCPHATKLRKSLGLCSTSRVLLFNTEGATDPENYHKQLRLQDTKPADIEFGFAAPLPQKVLSKL
jgi:diaminopropionate ammonia-lyase